MTNKVDRYEFLLHRQFPGYTTEVQIAVRTALMGPRRLSDKNVGALLEQSRGWDLRGSSVQPPVRGQFDDDDLGEAGFLAARIVHLRTWIDEAVKYDEYLNSVDDQEYETLYEREFLNAAASEQEKQLYLDRERFFSGPSARADMGFWITMGAWTAEEAVALSLGKDPRHVTKKSLKKESSTSPFVVEFASRLRLVDRATSLGHLATAIVPQDFAVWAAAKKLTLPADLTDLAGTLTETSNSEWEGRIQALGEEIVKLKGLSSAQANVIESLRQTTDDMNPKSKAVLMKIILGLVTHHHVTERNTINFKAIHSILLEYPQVKLSDGAIRRALGDVEDQLEITAAHLKQSLI
jgi:hypothetical protein